MCVCMSVCVCVFVCVCVRGCVRACGRARVRDSFQPQVSLVGVVSSSHGSFVGSDLLYSSVDCRGNQNEIWESVQIKHLCATV